MITKKRIAFYFGLVLPTLFGLGLVAGCLDMSGRPVYSDQQVQLLMKEAVKYTQKRMYQCKDLGECIGFAQSEVVLANVPLTVEYVDGKKDGEKVMVENPRRYSCRLVKANVVLNVEMDKIETMLTGCELKSAPAKEEPKPESELTTEELIEKLKAEKKAKTPKSVEFVR